MRDLQIRFHWDPMPWERQRDRGERLVTWHRVPRTGDLVNLILQNEDSQGTLATFEVKHVLWNADGLDGSQIHILLHSTGHTYGV